MTPKRAIKILRRHNRWRRGADIETQDPAMIGSAIDTLCDAVELFESKFTKLDKPKYSGAPMLDSVLGTPNADFRAWVDSLPPTYWTRYDLSAARIGWEAALQKVQSTK
jgi:hypothetical protein